MSVEDWARREAKKRFVDQNIESRSARIGYRRGIFHAFSALLSDEALHAMAVEVFAPHLPNNADVRLMRAALQAAITAVTEGDTE